MGEIVVIISGKMSDIHGKLLMQNIHWQKDYSNNAKYFSSWQVVKKTNQSIKLV